MLRETLTYPLRGESAEESLLVGSILAVVAGVFARLGVLAFLAVLPVVLLAGYALAVIRASVEGRPDPPAFTDVRALAADGARALVLTVGYLAVPTVVLVVTFTGSAPVESATFGTSLFVLAAGTVVLFGSASFAYLLPAGLAALARTGSLRAGVAPSRLRRSATDARYFVGWVTALSVAALAALLFGVFGALGRVGEVVALGVGFYAVVVVSRILGLSLAE